MSWHTIVCVLWSISTRITRCSPGQWIPWDANVTVTNSSGASAFTAKLAGPVGASTADRISIRPRWTRIETWFGYRDSAPPHAPATHVDRPFPSWLDGAHIFHGWDARRRVALRTAKDPIPTRSLPPASSSVVSNLDSDSIPPATARWYTLIATDKNLAETFVTFFGVWSQLHHHGGRSSGISGRPINYNNGWWKNHYESISGSPTQYSLTAVDLHISKWRTPPLLIRKRI